MTGATACWTVERLCEVARSNGGTFRVSWRYRDAGLQRLARKAVKQGLLKKTDGPPGAWYYRLNQDQERT